jgi:hypothetical protein
MKYCAYSFGTTREAMAAEAVLRQVGVPVKAIPTPLELGRHCGISMRIAPGDMAAAECSWTDLGLIWSARGELEDA